MIAIDLGSNTIRFIEFDGLNWGKSFEKIVRTAEGLDKTKEISTDAIMRIIDAIKEAKLHIDFTHQEVAGVTTAAIRQATNAQYVLETIAGATGIIFRIIDGTMEASLTLMAVQNRLNRLGLVPTSFLLVDIGGASTELTLLADNSVRSISLDIGILTMTEKSCMTSSLAQLLAEFEGQISAFLDKGPTFQQCVLSSGTPTTIAAYLLGMEYTTYDPEKVNGYLLLPDQCKAVLDDLMRPDIQSRSRYVGVGREELIATGIEMVISIFKATLLSQAIVIDDGLREGVALNYYFKDQLPHLT